MDHARHTTKTAQDFPSGPRVCVPQLPPSTTRADSYHVGPDHGSEARESHPRNNFVQAVPLRVTHPLHTAYHHPLGRIQAESGRRAGGEPLENPPRLHVDAHVSPKRGDEAHRRGDAVQGLAERFGVDLRRVLRGSGRARAAGVSETPRDCSTHNRKEPVNYSRNVSCGFWEKMRKRKNNSRSAMMFYRTAEKNMETWYMSRIRNVLHTQHVKRRSGLR